MESLKKIIVLLERFYSGETTLEEEKYLEQYFRESSVPEELLTDKELFLSIDSDPVDIEIPGDLNSKILHAIDQVDRKETKTRRISLFSLSGLAAGLLVMISVYLFFLKDKPDGFLSGNKMSDTYEDPMEAYEEAKKTLAYVSNKFNTGTDELKHVQQINKSVRNLQPLTFINRGNKEIRLLKQLEKAGEVRQ